MSTKADNTFVTENLSRVFDVYKLAGVLDEGIVIENLAFLALDWYLHGHADHTNYAFGMPLRFGTDLKPDDLRSHLINPVSIYLGRQLYSMDVEYLKKLIPSPPTELDKQSRIRVVSLAMEIFKDLTDIGDWFNRELITRFASQTRGGRYATPRHLVDFMTNLVQVGPQDEIADFACGTGGMLVARLPVKSATGIDISPTMGRLAFTNLILHGQRQISVFIENTFHRASQDHDFRAAKFDVILMNPPFGISIEPALVDASFMEYAPNKKYFTGRSETLFASLATDKLKPGGRMAVMVPSGVLFGTSSGESILRDILLEGMDHVSIISLPKDATQPYSALPTHILVAQNPVGESAYEDIWFYRARYDGFTSGRNRQPDTENNDLSVIEAAVSSHLKGAAKKTKETAGIQVLPLLVNKVIIGYEIKGIGDTSFQVVRQIPCGDSVPINFLVETNLTGSGNSFLVSRKNVFRSSEDSEGILLGMPSEIKLKSELEFRFADESLEGVGLLVKENFLALAEKKKTAQYYQSIKPGNNESFVFIIDDRGKLISPAVHIDTKFLKRQDHPHSRELIGVNKPISARLLVFPNGLKIRKFVSKDGKKALFFSIDNSWGVYLESDRRFIIGQVEPCYKSDEQHSGVLLDIHGDTLGVSVPADIVMARPGRDLQPSTYIPEKQVHRQERTPAQLLAEIKLEQNQLTAHIDRLLGIAEVRAVSTASLPPKATLFTQPPFIDGIQAAIWDAIYKKHEPADDYITPIPFGARDIVDQLENKATMADVQRTLDLFERMGMIVQVSYEGVPCYRILIEGDIENRGRS